MSEQIEEAPWGPTDKTLAEHLAERARTDGDFVFCRFGDERITLRVLAERVRGFADGLLRLGIQPGDRVLVMLPNHPDHIVAMLALMHIGTCQVPVNIQQRGAGLEYLFAHCQPRAAIVEASYAAQAASALAQTPVEIMIWRGGSGPAGSVRTLPFAEVAARPGAIAPPARIEPDQTSFIIYTSGTTGMPKGVMVSDRMLRVCSRAAARLADVREGDVLFLWEPLFHIAGIEVVALGLMERIGIALVERFSVSRFWADVRRYGATHIHFVGGVLALLLNQPPRADDADHPVRIAWGGGCPAAIWEPFEQRFHLQIRECYGMTEASSFTTINTEGKVGSIGKMLPYYDARIVDQDGRALGPGDRGEMWIREKVAGLIMRGYFRNDEATAAALQDGWLRTGDIAWYDDEGFFYYAGRKTDSVRRRGENIAAFEIERVVDQHPEVAESAVIGVANELADEDIKIFILPKPGCRPDPLTLIRWCEAHLARFQIPRYVAMVDSFEKTATERIRKELLPRAVDDCFDAEGSSYSVRGGQ